jgi:primosomal protein N'
MPIKKYIATCPKCDFNYEVEEEQDEIFCPMCHYEIDWELDNNWIRINKK